MAEVFISPAPQRSDTGISGFGTVERRMNLIADALEIELQRHGVSSQRALSGCAVYEAVAVSNANLPKIHLSLCTFSSDSSKSGIEIYHNEPQENGERLASDLAAALSEFSKISIIDCKAEFGSLGFYELTHTLAPSVMLMLGYQDNAKDVARIIESGYEISCAIAKGILQYFGKSYLTSKTDLKEDFNFIRFD